MQVDRYEKMMLSNLSPFPIVLTFLKAFHPVKHFTYFYLIRIIIHCYVCMYFQVYWETIVKVNDIQNKERIRRHNYAHTLLIVKSKVKKYLPLVTNK
jgi:hypothetical protein